MRREGTRFLFLLNTPEQKSIFLELNNPAIQNRMEQNTSSQTYAVVACTKCGKFTYAPARQKARQCPVCRRRFLVAGVEPLATFASPTEAARFIAAEEAKKTSRLDFSPVVGFAPASAKHIAQPRTEKTCGMLPKTLESFSAWVKRYFAQQGDIPAAGIPAMQVTAAAIKAGFVNSGPLFDQLVKTGVLLRPRSYTLVLAIKKE